MKIWILSLHLRMTVFDDSKTQTTNVSFLIGCVVEAEDRGMGIDTYVLK